MPQKIMTIAEAIASNAVSRHELDRELGPYLEHAQRELGRVVAHILDRAWDAEMEAFEEHIRDRLSRLEKQVSMLELDLAAHEMLERNPGHNVHA